MDMFHPEDMETSVEEEVNCSFLCIYIHKWNGESGSLVVTWQWCPPLRPFSEPQNLFSEQYLVWQPLSNVPRLTLLTKFWPWYWYSQTGNILILQGTFWYFCLSSLFCSLWAVKEVWHMMRLYEKWWSMSHSTSEISTWLSRYLFLII